jgi:hypothetical protein
MKLNKRRKSNPYRALYTFGDMEGLGEFGEDIGEKRGHFIRKRIQSNRNERLKRAICPKDKHKSRDYF